MDGSQADQDFKDWFNEMFKLDGTGTGSQLRRNGSVVKKQFQQEVMRFAFEGAWIKSVNFSDLDAATSDRLMMTVVMAIERMYLA